MDSHEPILAGRRYRLALTCEQERRLERWSGAMRALWNAALEQRQTALGALGQERQPRRAMPGPDGRQTGDPVAA
jgi:Helix-turn-helix domain